MTGELWEKNDNIPSVLKPLIYAEAYYTTRRLILHCNDPQIVSSPDLKTYDCYWDNVQFQEQLCISTNKPISMERVSYGLVMLLLFQYVHGQMTGNYLLSSLSGKIIDRDHTQIFEDLIFGFSYIETLSKCLFVYSRHQNVYVMVGAEICKTVSPSSYQCRLLMNYKKQGYMASDPSNQDCQFLEMEEKEVINVAAKRPTTASSILLGQSQFGPSNAVDGVTNCPLASGYLAMTQLQKSPWFQVDFESPVDVLKVLIIGRQDCCYERLHHVYVSVHDGVTYRLCGYYDGPPTQRTHIMVYCKNLIQSPLVVITLNGDGQQYLELCEVAVFGR